MVKNVVAFFQVWHPVTLPRARSPLPAVVAGFNAITHASAPGLVPVEVTVVLHPRTKQHLKRLPTGVYLYKAFSRLAAGIIDFNNLRGEVDLVELILMQRHASNPLQVAHPDFLQLQFLHGNLSVTQAV